MSGQYLKTGRVSPTRYIPLRFRFIFIATCMLILLLGSIALLVGIQQGRSVRRQVERRGLAIAQGIAATSTAALVTYDYISLEQAANRAVMDAETVYAIIHDKEGKVAGYTGRPDLQRKLLDDPATRVAISSMTATTQIVRIGEEGMEAVDVAVPVFLPGSEERWGTIRVALSLEGMNEQIRQTRMIIAGTGILALLLGILVSVWAARRITRPLGHLVAATVDAARGKLDQEIEVRTGDEVEVLAFNFSVMIREILLQRQQLEAQLSEIVHLQRYTERLLISMNDGLLSMDTDGRIAVINPSASRMLRVAEGIQKGHPVADLLEGIPPLKRYMEAILRNPGGTSIQQELFIERKEETQIVLASSSTLTDSQGKILEVITNLHDITQLKQLESRIRQAERLAALGTLAAGMAHEIRNPLSAIKTFVQLLPRKLEKPGFLEKFQRTVPRELDRINRLIEDLLELSRSPKYHFQKVDIGLLLQQVVDLFGEELRLGNVKHSMTFAQESPSVRADTDQLLKAFYNLIRNAIQAMPEGGVLTIEASRVEENPCGTRSVSQSNGWLAVAFRDTGHGITPENLKTIFNPFFTTKDTGTGLGLAITHKVISEHGGCIDVKSRAGKGSCLTVYIPVA